MDLLRQLFSTIITTPEVAKEFAHQLPEWVMIQPAKNTNLINQYLKYIDLGEASAIALSAEVAYDFVILDDSAARKFAEKLGITVKGTIGILVIAKNKGLIPLLKPYFDLIEQTNFRISKTMLNNILRDTGE